MDSGWAVVIGAGIALIGSAVVPWIRESVMERTRSEKQRRHDIAEALEVLIVALNDMLKARLVTAAPAAISPKDLEAVTGVRPNMPTATGWDVEPPLARLSLLLRSTEAPVITIAQSALGALQQGVMWKNGQVTLVPEAVTILRAFRATSSGWFRGEIKPDQVEARYNTAAAEALNAILGH